MPIRPAVFAGSFYPADPQELLAMVKGLLAQAPGRGKAPAPKAIVTPHAGYIYSGPAAAAAWSQARGLDDVRRVVLFGPCHRHPLPGIGLSAAEAFATPLGAVPLDGEFAKLALERGLAVVDAAAHHGEHCLEVQLPFVQAVLPRASIVPVLAGYACRPEQALELLDALWGGPETLIAISTDLSHYLSYGEARACDRRTADAILDLDAEGLGEEDACGLIPLQGLLLAARARGLPARELMLNNSGDTAGDRERVVGYGAFSFQ